MYATLSRRRSSRHHQISNDGGRHLAFPACVELAFDSIRHFLDRRFRNRPLLRGFAQPAEDLLAIVGLATAVFFFNVQARRFRPLERGESVFAGLAFAPAPYGILIVATIDDASIARSARRTEHR